MLMNSCIYENNRFKGNIIKSVNYFWLGLWELLKTWVISNLFSLFFYSNSLIWSFTDNFISVYTMQSDHFLPSLSSSSPHPAEPLFACILTRLAKHQDIRGFPYTFPKKAMGFPQLFAETRGSGFYFWNKILKCWKNENGFHLIN